MFNIFQRLRWVYLSVFAAQVVPMSAIITWRESVIGGHSSPYDVLVASVLKIDDVCYLSILTSVIIVDIGRYLVGILIEAPQDRAYKQGLSQGKEQGAAEERQRWLEYDASVRDYNRRFKDALERGESFNEPPPQSPTT